MERFPRGTLPPKAFAAVATVAPTAIARRATAEPSPRAGQSSAHAGDFEDDGPVARGVDPAKDLDLSTTCPNCNTQMQPEHAHYRCPGCGYRDSSSF